MIFVSIQCVLDWCLRLSPEAYSWAHLYALKKASPFHPPMWRHGLKANRSVSTAVSLHACIINTIPLSLYCTRQADIESHAVVIYIYNVVGPKPHHPPWTINRPDANFCRGHVLHWFKQTMWHALHMSNRINSCAPMYLMSIMYYCRTYIIWIKHHYGPFKLKWNRKAFVEIS